MCRFHAPPPPQGIDSQYIKYCEEEAGYALDPRLRLGFKQREMVTEMLEMGWLFTSVVRYNQSVDCEKTIAAQGGSQFVNTLEVGLSQKREDGGGVGGNSTININKQGGGNIHPPVCHCRVIITNPTNEIY